MTMPKKGTRKVHIEGTEFRYKVRPLTKTIVVEGGMVTIELPNGNYLVKDFEGVVTPSRIKEYLERTFPEGWPKK